MPRSGRNWLRRNVLIDPEHVAGVPACLDLDQTPVVVTIRGLSPLASFLLGEEIDIRTASREPAHVSPGSPRPLNVHLVIIGLLPGRGDVYDCPRIAVSDRRVAVRETAKRAVNREENDSRME